MISGKHFPTDAPIFWISAMIDGKWRVFNLKKSNDYVKSITIYNHDKEYEDYDYKQAKLKQLKPSNMDGNYKITRDFANRNWYGFCEGKTVYKYEMVDIDQFKVGEIICEFSIKNGKVELLGKSTNRIACE